MRTEEARVAQNRAAAEFERDVIEFEQRVARAVPRAHRFMPPLTPCLTIACGRASAFIAALSDAIALLRTSAPPFSKAAPSASSRDASTLMLRHACESFGDAHRRHRGLLREFQHALGQGLGCLAVIDQNTHALLASDRVSNAAISVRARLRVVHRRNLEAHGCASSKPMASDM